MTGLDETLAVLADPTRRAVIDTLARGPKSAGSLATAAGASPPAMSRHLRVLRHSGLVQERSDDNDLRVRIYSLRPDRLGDVRGWLDDVERFWAAQLDAFTTHMEGR
jgi:DNA-binding transcriptional ArsR family regulator